MKDIPYFERVIEAQKPFNPRPMKKYRDYDITEFEEIETEMMKYSMKCFEADKLDKIINIKADIMGGKIIVWATTIVPADEYAIPLFTAEVVQMPQEAVPVVVDELIIAPDDVVIQGKVVIPKVNLAVGV